MPVSRCAALGIINNNKLISCKDTSCPTIIVSFNLADNLPRYSAFVDNVRTIDAQSEEEDYPLDPQNKLMQACIN